MRTKVKLGLIFVLFGISLVIVGSQLSIAPESINRISIIPRSADDFTSPDIRLNSSYTHLSIKRELDTLNITFNNQSTIFTAEGGYIATIKDLGNTHVWNVTLNRIGLSYFHAGYFRLSITDPIGFYRIWIYALASSKVPQNDPNPLTGNHTWFRVTNNLPSISLTLNATTIKGGQSLGMNFYPNDLENPVANLTWSATINRNSDNTLITTLFSNKRYNSWTHMIPLNNTAQYAPGIYYVNASCKDLNNGVGSSKVTFEIKNNNPVIKSVTYFVNGVDKTSDSPISLKRGKDVLTVKVNATDLEANGTLRLSIFALDPITWLNITLNALNLVPINPTTMFFTKNITFPVAPTRTNLGLTNLTVRITETYATKTYSTDIVKRISIVNNLPEMSNFYINGKNETQLSFTDKDNLIFAFNVTDVENTIAYVKVNFQYEENDEDKSLVYIVPYKGLETTLRIRAVDLPFADYYIEAYVVDTDGGESRCIITYIVEIKPKTGWEPITWLLMVIGLIVGASLGFGITYWRYRMVLSGSKEEVKTVSREPVKGKSAKSVTPSDIKESIKEPERSEKEIKPKAEEKSKKKLIRKL